MKHYRSPAAAPQRAFRSPHFDPVKIPVHFAVLHYTAQSFSESLRIFLNPGGPKLSCHLLIDREGGVFELVPCWDGERRRAWHAGQSAWTDANGRSWRGFNDFSVGIELISWNGNFCPYTDSQYKALFAALNHLKGVYPALRDPERILGHEHIAGFRGKSDPGRLFDWDRLFKEVFQAPAPLPRRPPRMSAAEHKALAFLSNRKNSPSDKKARKISLILESPRPFWLKKALLRLTALNPFF